MSCNIREARQDDLTAFFIYLNDHLRDNGRDGTHLFMLMPRTASVFGTEKQAAFRNALEIAAEQPGWRKLWLAWDGTTIAGHIDLRARPEHAAAHRVLLGMGVHRDYRRHGLGLRLIAEACQWALTYAALDWIDLEVLSTNTPARRLYHTAGFE